MPRCRAMLAAMTGQQPRRPEFVRVSHILGLPACQGHQPRPCFHRDLRLLARPRTVVESRHNPEPARPCQATLHCLVRHTNGTADRIARRVIPIVQQDPGSTRLDGSVREPAIDRSSGNPRPQMESPCNRLVSRNRCTRVHCLFAKRAGDGLGGRRHETFDLGEKVVAQTARRIKQSTRPEVFCVWGMSLRISCTLGKLSRRAPHTTRGTPAPPPAGFSDRSRGS